MLSQTKTFAGGWYCDALPSGEYAAIRFDSTTVETHLGPLTSAPERVLFPRITKAEGRFRVAGQGHNSDRVMEWNGAWNIFQSKACGVSPVIYDNTGRLLVSDCGPGIGSQGFRFVRPDNSVASGDSTYAPANGIDLYEWTDLGDGMRAGQGPNDNGAWLYDGERYFEIIPGRARFVRAARDGDKLSFACWVEPQESVIVWTTLAEIRATLPGRTSPRLAQTPEPEPPPVVVPVPEVPTMSIPSSEIVAAVTESKAEVEALGYVFKTVEQAMRDNYAHYTYADKQQAFLVTMRAAWKLAQTYPDAGIGLELYNGPSGTPSPFPEDGTDRYSGDIILLSKSGPSVDVLIAGVQPAAQVDTTTDPQAPANWRRDWRAPLNPYRGVQPVPVPVPVPAPTPVPTPEPAPTVDLSEVLATLERIEGLVAYNDDEVMELRKDVAAIRAMLAGGFKGNARFIGAFEISPKVVP